MSLDHGLVIGKFYPPHAGHHLLVRTASALCRRVSVVVMASYAESLPLACRVASLREVHARDKNVTIVGVEDNHPVDLASDAVWRAHVQCMREGVRAITSEPVTAVFTSEDYGRELARRLEAVHVPVDPARGLYPVSGTAVRRDPVAHWDYLAAPMRGVLARRVVVVGAESTGKTTLARELADHLRLRRGAFGLSRWVAEYGRDATILLLSCERARAAHAGRALPSLEQMAWPSEVFVRIAEEQNAIEDAEARVGGPILVCDTDAFATGVWHERYVGRRSEAVEALGRKHALYLLTHPDDVPFVQDGLRDGERIRHAMTSMFVERLTESGRMWQWVRGAREERVRGALAAIEGLLARGFGFTDPLG